MNVLIIFAHPDPASFDATLCDRTISELTAQGHSVQLSDLYDMRFRPVVLPDDFTDRNMPTRFNLHAEQAHAVQHGTFAPDILAEQRKVAWADTLIFIFPLWWYSLPAIIKGWFDRVMAYGFAYGPGGDLMGRRALLVTTTGGPPRPFTPEKQHAINQLLDHVQRGMLHFCGLRVLPPHAIYGAVNANKSQRDQFLRQYLQMLRTLEDLAPLSFD